MTPEDLAGVKLRMPNSEAWIFLGKALGANPTPVPFGEVYLSLQTGTIDGQDNPLPTDKAAKFYEVTKQIVLTDHLVDGILLGINSRTWNKLSDEQKQLVEEAAQAAAHFNNVNRIQEEQQLVSFFKEQGLEVYQPDLEAFRQHVLDAYANDAFSADWPENIIADLDAVEILPECEF